MSDYTLVYTEGGVRAHLLDGLLSPNQPNSALCGRTPGLWPNHLWLGTGSQDEHERALDLQLCAQCASIRSERADGMLTR